MRASVSASTRRPKPYEKGGEGFAKRGAETRPVRKAYVKRHDDAVQDPGRSERPAGKPWRESKDPAKVAWRKPQGAKPFEKRRFGERKQGEVGERKFVRREAAGPQDGERKPFVKRPHVGPGERRDAEGRPQYWGQAPR